MITRENVDEMIDKGQIEVAIQGGRWWKIRRNGATQRWKIDARRIRIPYKFGLRGYGAIDENDFVDGGELNRIFYRERQEA